MSREPHRSFFSSLFDYSFSSFVTPRIIRILYVLATILISLWTLALVLAGFNISSGAGLVMLVVVGPLLFLISMIYARVGLELIIVFFRINGNVQEIRDERTGGAPQPAPAPEPPPVTAPVLAPAASAETEDEPAVAATAIGPGPQVATPTDTAATAEDPLPSDVRYCENCGAERRPGGKFCTSCGYA